MTDEPREPTPEELEAERLAALEKGVEEIASGTRFDEMPDTTHLDDRFRSIKNKVSKQKGEPQPGDGGGGHWAGESGEGYRSAGVALSVAYALVGCTIVGWGIGWLIDRNTGGNIAQAVGGLIGAVTGLVSAVFLAFRSNS